MQRRRIIVDKDIKERVERNVERKGKAKKGLSQGGEGIGYRKIQIWEKARKGDVERGGLEENVKMGKGR